MQSFILDPRKRRDEYEAAKLKLAMNPATDVGSGLNAVAAALMARKQAQGPFPNAPGGNVLTGLFRLGQKGGLY